MQTIDEKNLSQLTPGVSGVVSHVSSEHRELKVKILSLGLVMGTLVKVVNVAPLGDPITIEVRGSRISLRKSEASIVKIMLPEIGEQNYHSAH